MKGLMIILTVVLTSAPFAAYAQVPAEAASEKPVVVGNKICPVSGAKILADAGMAPVMYEYKGRVYNLCCSGCLEAFKADPEKYSKIADQEVLSAQKQMSDAPVQSVP
ncbi:MAG: YHS domain-containing protein [Candidatus Omnitrophica bacterium]|nr:YHS domain-containing protein [Candidatus Omnitrophota bacterium]